MSTDSPLPAELQPEKTSFAYRVRHSANALPDSALNAMWFSGEDRALPREQVAEPIVTLPAKAIRPTLSREALCSHAAIVAAEHDLPIPFFANLIHQESGFKTHVISSAGAQGIAQFMPRVARYYGLENPFDPLHSLQVSAKFLRELLAQFGNLGLAAAAYNAGPRRVQEWMSRRGKLPEETRNYVRNITGHPAERWARVNAKMEETRLPAHARCPDMPAVEVAVPEAAPVRVAKSGAKGSSKGAAKVAKGGERGEKGGGSTKVAAVGEEGPKEHPKEGPNTKAAREEGPKLAAAKSYTLASLSSGRQTAVIKNGKLQIMAPEKSAKKGAAAKVADARPAKPEKKDARSAKKDDKAVAKPTKVAAKSSKDAKPAGKGAAKSKPTNGKRVKVAVAR